MHTARATVSVRIRVSCYGVSGEISTITLFWDSLHISETNRARQLKFGTLVGIYEYYGSM